MTTDHAIEPNEILTALAEYVSRRDGLDQSKAYRTKMTQHCEILQIGAPGPMFTIHLTPTVVSVGGKA